MHTPTEFLEHPLKSLHSLRTASVVANLKAMMELPYPADPELEPAYIGLTCGQVALLRQVQNAARGRGDALDRVLDRMIGKPVNTNVNVDKPVTYQDFLDGLAHKETISGAIDVDSTAVESDPDSIS